MDSYLDQIFLDNTIRSYLVSAGIIAGVILLRKLLSQVTAWLISRLFVNKRRTFNYKNFSELILAPIQLFLTVLAVIIALERLHFPEVFKIAIYKTDLHNIVEAIARGILIGCFMWLCNRIIIYISNVMHEVAMGTDDKSDDQLVMFFRDFLKVIVWIIGILLIMKFSFGFDLGNVLTGLSIVGAAVALAFRESIENLIASFIVFFNKPFTVGDLIKIENHTGTVEKIGLRSTRVRTNEKTFMTVPNKKMVDSILDNHSLRTQRNVSTKIEFDLKAKSASIRGFIEDVEALLEATPGVEDFSVFLADTGQHANLVQVDYFVSMQIQVKSFFKMRQMVNLQLLDLVEKHNLEMAGENTKLQISKENPQ